MCSLCLRVGVGVCVCLHVCVCVCVCFCPHLLYMHRCMHCLCVSLHSLCDYVSVCLRPRKWCFIKLCNVLLSWEEIQQMPLVISLSHRHTHMHTHMHTWTHTRHKWKCTHMQQEHTFINHWTHKHTNYNTLEAGSYLNEGNLSGIREFWVKKKITLP